MHQQSHNYLCLSGYRRRTVPYGMSSYRGPQRLRREVVKTSKDREAKSQRCACAVPGDPECQLFCQSRSVGAFTLYNVGGFSFVHFLIGEISQGN